MILGPYDITKWKTLKRLKVSLDNLKKEPKVNLKRLKREQFIYDVLKQKVA
jgi:hypothetical protein